MINRKRKKWLKKHNKYVNPRDTWNLDYNIASYVLPRLRLFKKVNNGYPGVGEMDMPEKWDAAIDKMIRAFEIVIMMDDMEDRYWPNGQFNQTLWDKDDKEKKEGLHLFAEWFQQLWW